MLGFASKKFKGRRSGHGRGYPKSSRGRPHPRYRPARGFPAIIASRPSSYQGSRHVLGTEIKPASSRLDRNPANVVLSAACCLRRPQNRRAEDPREAIEGHAPQRAPFLDRRLRRVRRPQRHDGLDVHLRLSWNHVNHPSEVVKIGDEVEVRFWTSIWRRRIARPQTDDGGIRGSSSSRATQWGTIVDGR